MSQRIRVYLKILFAMAMDAGMINVSMYLAMYLRFDVPHIPAVYLQPYLHVAVFFTLATIVLFWIMRIYHRLWQYAGSRDAQVLIGAILGSAVLLGASLFLVGASHYPRGVYLLYVLFALALVGGWRFLLRSYYDFTWIPRSLNAPRILIVGAGKAGQLVAQELSRHPEVGIAIGFLDDDQLKRGMQIGALKVLGTTPQLRQVARDHGVDQVLFAIPSAAGSVLRPLVEECRRIGVKVRTLPAINQMIGGQVLVSQIRDVQIEDLLQREPATVDLAEIAGYVTGRTVMVTGAGGTIGSELARQVALFAPKNLILLGLDETSIFDIDRELRTRHPELSIVPVVADLRDQQRLEQVLSKTRPQVIFHAAAHKHVPLMEVQPPEAIRNNVQGLWQLIDMSHRLKVETFVFISTDKAVNPTSVYGTTKRIGEMLINIYAKHSSTRFVTVRFGNVLGSRGSVIPIFQQQISQGGPVTITHPDMVRYFMTVAEACQLVIQAGAMGLGGEIFVLDMGEPIRILDLASNLIRLSGLKPGQDIDIVVTGLRPGEKLYEELLTREDQTQATKHERIFVHNGQNFDHERVLPLMELLVEAAQNDDERRIRHLLREIVPEYQPMAPVPLVRDGDLGQGGRIRVSH
ncbi:MAG: polysaccharide biosynthesis protein [Sulfobacillus benefaciens]|uniref:Polysaccharide biosynthesis protein n=1 Tax=Sulfobacillus benefaciens TaxID=453960 RepID=A0A2T2X9B3_9FIRM|nr:MAG: polysaccharide biosynthesis protein [Sulfobacillus benefaciens]